MTEAEQDRIVDRVLGDHVRAKKRLACLEEKGERLSLQFGLLANWLGGHFPTGVALQEDLSISQALALIEEIKTAKAEIARLEARREQLGV